MIIPSPYVFEELVTELSPTLARYLLRQVGDSMLAEDLLQETLLRVARGLPDFDGRSTIKTWAFAIAARVTIDYFRRAASLPLTIDLSETDELPDGARTPEDGLAIEQMNTCVRQVIDSLPENYRAAILLHDFGGLSALETAVACGCSEANAKVRIHRGRSQVKQALEQECDLYRDSDNVLRCHRRNSSGEVEK